MVGYLRQYLDDPSFELTIRMNRRTFNLLVSLLEPSLLVDEEMSCRRGGAINPSMCVYMTLRYLAGGSHHDLKSHLGISKASFYRCLTKTKLAICNCSELDIVFPTSQRELAVISGVFKMFRNVGRFQIALEQLTVIYCQLIPHLDLKWVMSSHIFPDITKNMV